MIQPTLDDWIEITLEIFRMEKLTYQLRIQKEKFLSNLAHLIQSPYESRFYLIPLAILFII